MRTHDEEAGRAIEEAERILAEAMCRRETVCRDCGRFIPLAEGACEGFRRASSLPGRDRVLVGGLLLAAGLAGVGLALLGGLI